MITDTEKLISVLVKNQFPTFYQTEGPNFIAFVRSYYEWLEQEGNALGYSRDLQNLRDIDLTVDEFVDHFKEKYLNGISLTSDTDTRELVKHATELYRSKGTSRSVELLFRLLYNEDAQVVYPGDEVLRPSDGTWVIPIYLELSPTVKAASFVGKTVTGAASGATGIVEGVARRSIQGKVIDVVYMSSVKGLFQTGELVSVDNSLIDAPEVIGSLTEIDILNPGRNFAVGDVVDLVSNNIGKQARARVSETATATGRVDFTLEDGGTGYTTTANVLVSSKVLFINNFVSPNTDIGEFVFREVVRQDLANIEFISSNTTFVAGQQITGRHANGSPAANGYILSLSQNAGAGWVLAQVSNGDFNLASSITVNATAGAIVTAYTNRSATGIKMGGNSSAIGVVSVSNTFVVSNATPTTFITGLTNLATANLVTVSTGQDATFSIGSVTDTEQVFLNTDFIGANNSANVPYLSIKLTGEGSNVGFVASVNVVSGGTGYTNGASVSFTGGTPTSAATATITTDGSGVITVVNVTSVGSGYDSAPSASVSGGTGASLTSVMDYGYGFPKLPNGDANNIINELLTRGIYTIGTIASLTNINPGSGYNADPFVTVIEDKIAPFGRKNLLLSIANASGSFVVGETLNQQVEREAYTLTLAGTVGLYQAGETVRQVQANTNVVLGEVSSYDLAGSKLHVYATQTFDTSNNVVGLTSTATANVSAVVANNIVGTAKGIVLASNSSTISIKRTRFATSFADGLPVTGDISGSTADVVNVSQINDSPVMGNNAIVTADAGTANGIIQTLQVISSGFAYEEGEIVSIRSDENNFIGTGVVRLLNQGIGEGFWSSTRGFLNNKYIHDSDYYQDYSYEIQTASSLDRYSEVLKRVMHVAGTKLFGKVVICSKELIAPFHSQTTIILDDGSGPFIAGDYFAEDYVVY